MNENRIDIVDVPKYNKYQSKSVMFLSVASVNDTGILLDAKVNEILVSYHYIKKRKSEHQELLDEVSRRDGLYMMDSGVFSFMGSLDMNDPKVQKEDFWKEYRDEYLEYLELNAGKIFSAVNLDLEYFIGKDKVDRWNEDYFKPLTKKMQIVFAVKPWITDDDKSGMKRFQELCDNYHYVAVTQDMKKHSGAIFSKMQTTPGLKVHGLAWTSIPMLKSHPLFSVDSSTWMMGHRYGVTYTYDGKNFRTYEGSYKVEIRKKLYKYCEIFGIDNKALVDDTSNDAITLWNALAWKGAKYEVGKIANQKLVGLPVAAYDFSKKKKFISPRV